MDGHEFEDAKIKNLCLLEISCLKKKNTTRFLLVFLGVDIWPFFPWIFYDSKKTPGTGSNHVTVCVEEDNSCDSERSHTKETFSVCAFAGPCVL